MVHALGSFSQAAEKLGITQSTVSYTVDRLRRVFGDPLFVRQGGATVATDRCNEIVTTAARMTDEFSAILEPRAFDPSKAQAEVTLSCNYYERITLVPHLVRILRNKAPGLRLNVLSSNVMGKGQLERGESDMLIGPVSINDTGYYRRKLLRDHSVVIMAKDNPLVGVDLDIPTYLAAPHVVVIYGGTWQSRYLIEIEARGYSLNSVMEVPSPAALPMTLQGTDLISTVPKRIALAFGDAVHVAPAPFPASVDIDLYWNSRTHHSAMHRWLRAQLADHVAPSCAVV